jgi:hypothetical protein
VAAAVGRVLLGGQDRGSGFASGESRVLTAGHVVRDAATAVGSHRARLLGRTYLSVLVSSVV